MRRKFPVLTVKKLLKSVYIYGSYRKNKTGVPFFWTTLYKCFLPQNMYDRRITILYLYAFLVAKLSILYNIC